MKAFSDRSSHILMARKQAQLKLGAFKFNDMFIDRTTTAARNVVKFRARRLFDVKLPQQCATTELFL